MSFTARIGQITGSASANDANTIELAMLNAQHEIISRMAQLNPGMLHSMSADVEYDGSGTQNKVDVNTVILNVTRVDKENSVTRNCAPIDMKFTEKALDTDSIYYAPRTSPVYAFDNGTVQIYPVASSLEKVQITKVVPGAISDNSETVANMPSSLIPQLINISSRDVLLQRLGGYRDSLPTDLNDTTVFDAITDADVSLPALTKSLPANFSSTITLPTYSSIGFPSDEVGDALSKAQALVDDVSQIGGDVNVDGSGTDIYSAQKWLVDEDPEMLTGTLQTAAQELQRANAIVSEHNTQIQSRTAEYNNAMTKYTTEITKEAQRVQVDISEYQAELQKNVSTQNQELQEYQANLTKKIQSYTTLISKLNTDYQWITGQLQMVMQRIQDGWSLIGIKNQDSQAKGLGGGISK